jgi:carboxymethylenebutenolidase
MVIGLSPVWISIVVSGRLGSTPPKMPATTGTSQALRKWSSPAGSAMSGPPPPGERVDGLCQALLLELPVDRAARDLRGAVDYLLSRDEVVGETVGVVGFCMGGAFALQLAVQEGGKLAAAVAFYPTGYMPDDYAGLQAPVLIHIADGDQINPPTLAQELNEKISADTGSKPEIDHYPAGHAFLNEEDLLGTYDAEQARIAWDRTVAFLGAHLG